MAAHLTATLCLQVMNFLLMQGDCRRWLVSPSSPSPKGIPLVSTGMSRAVTPAKRHSQQ